MSNEIGVTGLATGLTLYATIRDATNQVWNGSAFEAQVQANLSTYAVMMTENGTTGTYLVAFPAAIAAGAYSRTVRSRVGGSPAWTDPVLASDSAYQWSGTAEVSLASRSAATQIPANFTAALFASAGVFSVGALANTPASLDAAALRSAMGLATANLDTQLALRTGFKLASDGFDSIMIEPGVNARQSLSVVTAAMGGVLAGAAGTTVTIAAANNPGTNRVSATVDADGNRSAVTLNLPA